MVYLLGINILFRQKFADFTSTFVTMMGQRFAVVDVETTGGYAAGNRITEIGVVITNGTQVLDSFHTLINPETDIPQHITRLTGITNAMVKEAPTFATVANALLALFKDAVFVAHNANFDYSFVQMELARLGYNFSMKKLCTVRYARSVLKDQSRFSLAHLAKRFAINNEQPHRALSDALTAAQILQNLLKIDQDATHAKAQTRVARDIKLPLHVTPEQFHAIPNVPGIYVMYGAQGKPIYIGKAKRLKQRVAQHFANIKSARTQALLKEVVRLETQPTGTELMALIKEDVEIRKHWPVYNRAQKKRNTLYHIVGYTDRADIKRLGIQKAHHIAGAYKTLSSQREALLCLHQLVDTFALNPAWCGLGSGWQQIDPPDQHTHNARMAEVHDFYLRQNETQLLFLQGRNAQEKGFIWLVNAHVHAFGFAPEQLNWHDKSALEAHSERIYASTTVNNLIAGYLATATNPSVLSL